MTLLEKILKDENLSKKILNIFQKLSAHIDGSCRNVDNRILEVVDENYKNKDYIIANGEIYIKEKFLGFHGGDRIYLCKKLKFDMQTSEELYEVREFYELDGDGEYSYTDYEINLFKEKE